MSELSDRYKHLQDRFLDFFDDLLAQEKETARLKAKVEELTKVIRMLKLEAECTSDKYLRGAILGQTVAALKQE